MLRWDRHTGQACLRCLRPTFQLRMSGLLRALRHLNGQSRSGPGTLPRYQNTVGIRLTFTADCFVSWVGIILITQHVHSCLGLVNLTSYFSGSLGGPRSFNHFKVSLLSRCPDSLRFLKSRFLGNVE